METCNHPDPELCKQLKKHIHGRLYEIWMGTAQGVTAEQCEEYRVKWKKEAGIKVEVSLIKQAVNLTKATTEHVKAGMPQADEATVAARQAICLTCPHRTPEDRCAKCGCSLRLKISWQLQKCPLELW